MSENTEPHVVKFVYDFTEGNKDLKDLLGGKGANLAEMTNLGLPVPPGFTITTEACKTYLDSGDEPAALRDEVSAHLDTLEATMGKQLGQADDPLLVSVRSGAKFSMPGMMDTVLNIGLSDKSVQGLAKQAGDERFAWDSYRRLIQMFGKTVLGVDGDLFEEALDKAKDAKKVTVDTELDAADLKKLVTRFKRIVKAEAGRDFPQDPREQMDLAIHAVFDSWNTDRAKLYRRQERIPHDLGTAVNVCSMVFGNLGPDSGTGVAFTRDPAQRPPGRLRRLLAERAGRGRRRRHPEHRAAGGTRADRQEVVRPAHADHGDPGEPLQGSLRHRIHHRARPVVDAPDAGGEADGGCRLPYRHPARRPGADRRGRGPPAGHRRAVGAADVPALRRGREGPAGRPGHRGRRRARRSARRSSTRTPR